MQAFDMRRLKVSSWLLASSLYVLAIFVGFCGAQQLHYQYHREITSQQQTAASSGTGCVNNGRDEQQGGYSNPLPTSFYHAPARQVPVPPVDPQIKRQFLLLFHRDLNHTHGTPHDAPTTTSGPINQTIIDQINALCPRDSFFYSFAPRHLNAIQLLQRVFTEQRTASELVTLARTELYRHEINSRVWYYALLGTLLMRPDLNGYYLAWALDATPDLYIPASIINTATEGSSRPQLVPQTGPCDAQQLIQQLQPSQSQVVQQQQSNQPRPASGPGFQQPQFQNFQGPAVQNQQQQFRPSPSPGFQQQPLQNFQGPMVQQQTSRPASGPVFQNQQQLQPQPLLGPVFQQQPVYSTRAATSPNYFYQLRYKRSPMRPKRQRPAAPRQGQGIVPPPPRSNRCLVYNGTRGASGPENLLWYYREDIMANQHHWYWHQYFPQTSSRHADRRGEQFYFTHHNIIARYNAERLSNGLPRETALDLRLDGNIGSGYDSGLIDKQSERYWTPRVDNTLLSDINHGQDPDFQLNVTMAEIARLYQTLITHIGEGFLFANRSTQQGQPPTEFRLPIRNAAGISELGNTVEAAEELSTHANFYHTFGVHNLGHIAIALSSDPDFSCRRPTGVMADLTVTMRDPAFYKVHTFVDDIFDHYKRTLTPYHPTEGEWPLIWNGVTLQIMEVISAANQVNYLRTNFQTTRFPLEEGLDGSIHEGDVNVDICHQHLNHEPFTFRLTIDVGGNTQSQSSRGTVRIFMAPRYDVTGARFGMGDTRRLMFQLDHFPVDLRQGRNIITRNARDSSSTKPWTRSLQQMLQDPDNQGQTEYCGCGWPDHLYIPRGSPQGMQFDVFAMITNFDQDQVQDTPEDLRIPEPCHSPHLFCGVPYRRYPDQRPMGYPFDRQVYSVVDAGGNTRLVNSLEEWVANVPNSRSTVVVVQHVG